VERAPERQKASSGAAALQQQAKAAICSGDW
jgi:hypothetical protein